MCSTVPRTHRMSISCQRPLVPPGTSGPTLDWPFWLEVGNTSLSLRCRVRRKRPLAHALQFYYGTRYSPNHGQTPNLILTHVNEAGATWLLHTRRRVFCSPTGQPLHVQR